MTIRCRACHGIVWVQPVHTGSGTATVRCGSCGQQYVLESWKPSQRADRAMSVRAHRLAKEHGVDLPGAYSLLLGIMTAQDLREIGGAGATPDHSVGTMDDSTHSYDPEFQPAIDEGILTPRQAAERGQRDAYAAILASRHRLPREVAYQLADNRTSLLAVLRDRARKNEGALRVALRPARIMRTSALLALLVLVAASAIAIQGSGVGVRLGPGKQLTFGESLAQTDGTGRVTRVQGPNPRSVLRAYCAAHAGGGRLRPLEVIASAQTGRMARLGLLQDTSRPTDLLAVTINEDRKSGHWTVGDGRGPVVPELAPAGAGRALRKASGSQD